MPGVRATSRAPTRRRVRRPADQPGRGPRPDRQGPLRRRPRRRGGGRRRGHPRRPRATRSRSCTRSCRPSRSSDARQGPGTEPASRRSIPRRVQEQRPQGGRPAVRRHRRGVRRVGARRPKGTSSSSASRTRSPSRIVVIGHYDREGRLRMYSATQVPHYLHRALSRGPRHADAPDPRHPPDGRRRLRREVGPVPARDDLRAALAQVPAARCGSRSTARRSSSRTTAAIPSDIDVAVGVNADGKLSGLDIDALIDGGAYGSFGVVTTYYNGVLRRARTASRASGTAAGASTRTSRRAARCAATAPSTRATRSK